MAGTQSPLEDGAEYHEQQPDQSQTKERAHQTLESDQMNAVEYVRTMNLNGMTCLRQGRNEEALRFLSMAREVVCGVPVPLQFSMIPGPMRRELKAVTLNNLGCFYKEMKRYHLALEYCKSALDIERKLPVPLDVQSFASTHLNVCSILSNLRRHREALEHAQMALQLVESDGDGLQSNTTEGYSSPMSVRTVAYYNMSVQYEMLGDSDHALKTLSAAHDAAKAELGPRNPVTIEIHGHLVRKQSLLQRQKPKSSGSVKEGKTGVQRSLPRPSSGSTPRSNSRPASAMGPRAFRAGADSTRSQIGDNRLQAMQTRRTQVVYESRPVSAAASPRQRRVAIKSSPRRPTSAPVHPDARLARSAQRPKSGTQPTSTTLPRYGIASALGNWAPQDPAMEQNYQSTLSRLKSQAENARMVTPSFLQTINDCAQHYYFTNSNAQYRAAGGERLLHSPR